MRLPVAVRQARVKLYRSIYRGAIRNLKYSQEEARFLADQVLKIVSRLSDNNARQRPRKKGYR